MRDLQAHAFLDRRDEVEFHPRRLGVTSRFRYDATRPRAAASTEADTVASAG